MEQKQAIIIGWAVGLFWMGCQSLIVAGLTYCNLIKLTAGQQLGTGLGLIVSVLILIIVYRELHFKRTIDERRRNFDEQEETRIRAEMSELGLPDDETEEMVQKVLGRKV